MYLVTQINMSGANKYVSEDLDINISKKIPKKGRRAGLLFTPQTDNESSLSNIDGLIDSPRSTTDGFFSPPKTRKSDGWAEESIHQHKERIRDLRDDESDSDIPVIPDLDDIEDDMLSMTMNDTENKNSGFKELNTELFQQGVFDIVSCLDGVDLSILTRFLQEENQITESDEPWTWDSLFTEVTSDMNQIDEI